MRVPPHVLAIRRQYWSEIAEVLARQYRALKLIDGLSDADAYMEIMTTLETTTDTLSRMGIPPAWGQTLEE